MFKHFTGAIALLFLFGGCATAKFDKTRAQAAKRIAILAIEIQQEQPKDAFGIKKMSELKSGRPGDSAELKSMALAVYKDALTQISSVSGWKPIGFETVAASGLYKTKYEELMTGFRTMAIMPAGYERISPPKIMDLSAFNKLSAADKTALARSVGADAFATLMIYMPISQGFSFKNISGDAAFTFKARSNLDVYDLADVKEPLWRIQNVDGEKSPSSLTAPEGSSQRDKLALIGEKAAATSIRKVVTSYQR